MLDPAPQPEGDRGGAEPVHRRQDPRGDGGGGGVARQGRRLRFRRHRRVHRRQGSQLLFPRDEYEAPGRASGDRARHRPRPRRGDAEGRGRREAQAQAEGRGAQRLGHRGADLCRGPGAEFHAVDGTLGPLPAAARGDRRWRDHAARFRRRGGRRDLGLLRPDDRQADRPCAEADGGHRAYGQCARRLRHRRLPPQHPVSRGR